MPRTCTVCTHPERQAIDKALVAGQSARQCAAIYRVSPDAVERHKAAHLPVRLVQAQEAAEVANADDLLGQVRALHATTLGILKTAEEAGKLTVALGAIREARGNLELLAKLLGEIDDRPQVAVLIASPEWLALRARIVAALVPYPEARAALAEVLSAGRS